VGLGHPPPAFAPGDRRTRTPTLMVVVSSPAASDTDRSGGSGGLAPFLVAAMVGFGVRLWQLGRVPPSWWQDSSDYLEVGSRPLRDPSLWAGARPPLVSYLVALFSGGQGERYVFFQVVLAALCWAALATQASADMPTWARRAVAFVAVLAFSLTVPVTMWDRSVLSESLGLSLLAAFVASGIWLLRRPGGVRLAALVGVGGALVATRDTNAVLVGGVAVMLGGTWVALRWRARRERGPGVVKAPKLMLIGTCSLLVVVGLSSWSSTVGDRGDIPLLHVFSVRVLPYEDRLQWFADQGMPDVDLFLPVPAGPPDPLPVIAVSEDDPDYAAWREWLRRDGRSTWVRWVATHPAHLVTEPLLDPERVFNNAGGEVTGYAGTDLREVPGVTSLLWLPTIPTAAAALAVLGWCWWRVRRPRPLAVVASASVALSAPLAFVAWHADGVESARHLVTSAVSLRLGAVLAGLVLLEAVAVSRRRSGAVPDGADDEHDADGVERAGSATVDSDGVGGGLAVAPDA